jgi:hypothetical protein
MATRRFVVPVTTDASGNADVYSPILSGHVNQITYVKTNFTDGVDFTITGEATGITLWTESNVNATKYSVPRIATNTTAGVASLYAAGGTAVNDQIALSRDRVRIQIAQGGNATTGTFHITVTD